MVERVVLGGLLGCPCNRKGISEMFWVVAGVLCSMWLLC